jgi:2-polyprenyl-3-methyl-5-hydroxy-6-metoxy-1,4-benzoquinol methylase
VNKAVIYEQYDRFVHASWSIPPTESEYKIWARQARSRLTDLLPKNRNSRILDLGCGAGHLLYFLRECGFTNIQGVDVCAGAVAKAQRMGLSVENADISSFLETDEYKFDCITGADIIDHFTQDQVCELLRLIRLRLNPGGTVIFQTINGESPWCQSYFAGDPTHETLFTPRSLKSLLGLQGFSEFVVREVVPPPEPIKHMPRHYAWKVLRLVYATWNFIETGTGISGVYSRNFLLRAELPRS